MGADGESLFFNYPMLVLLNLPASLLAVAFAGQRLLDAEFLAGLQIEGVPFDFSDDVFLQNLPLEAPKRVLHRLAVLQNHLSQRAPLTLTATLIRCPAPAAPRDISAGFIRPLPASGTVTP